MKIQVSAFQVNSNFKVDFWRNVIHHLREKHEKEGYDFEIFHDLIKSQEFVYSIICFMREVRVSLVIFLPSDFFKILKQKRSRLMINSIKKGIKGGKIEILTKFTLI